MPGGAGYDISASVSNSASTATGATQFGNTGLSAIGGSVGLSTNTVLLIVCALVAVWFFFLRKK